MKAFIHEMIHALIHVKNKNMTMEYFGGKGERRAPPVPPPLGSTYVSPSVIL